MCALSVYVDYVKAALLYVSEHFEKLLLGSSLFWATKGSECDGGGE